MESEWNPVVTWFCLGLFALAEFGNVQMGGEIRRVCALIDRAADREIVAICANRVPDENYGARLAAHHVLRD